MMRAYDDDLLCRVYHAAKYVSRRQAKLELHLAGLPSTSADVDAAIDTAKRKVVYLQPQIEALERARRERIAASEAVAGFEAPMWMWCSDAEYEQEDRWLVYSGRGWVGVFKVVARSEVPEGCASVTIDPDRVLVAVDWIGKTLLPQTKADILEAAAGVAALNLGVTD